MSNDKVWQYVGEDGSFDICIDPSDNTKWTVIQQEAYSLEKQDIVMKKFAEEFPNFSVDSYKMLTDACSRSEAMSLWLINANLTYSQQAQVPLFLKDTIEPSKFVDLQTNLTRINKKISDISKEKRDLADKYKSDLRKLDLKELKETKDLKDKDKFLHILSLNSSSLPFSVQINIEKYVPNDKENMQESRQMYARECLILYKKGLCEILSNNPDVDIVKIIEENRLK